MKSHFRPQTSPSPHLRKGPRQWSVAIKEISPRHCEGQLISLLQVSGCVINCIAVESMRPGHPLAGLHPEIGSRERV